MIEELKTFIEVVECKNFTKTAKKINLSQPSVSVHIKRLENYFDTILINRSNKTRNIEITQAGYIVYDNSKKIINMIRETEERVLECKGITGGNLIIGASETIGNYLLPKLLAEFTKDYPNVHIEVIIENTSSICKKLNNLEIDIGLIEGIDTHFDFIREDFYEDRLVLVVSKEFDMDEKPYLKNLQNKIWISREDGSGTQEYLKLFLNSKNIHPKNIIVFSSNYSVKEAVKNNMGVTIISEYVVKDALKLGELSILPIEVDYNRKFSYILQKDKERSNIVDKFLERLKNY